MKKKHNFHVVEVLTGRHKKFRADATNFIRIKTDTGSLDITFMEGGFVEVRAVDGLITVRPRVANTIHVSVERPQPTNQGEQNNE